MFTDAHLENDQDSNFKIAPQKLVIENARK
jgi:hypothetical protein